MIDLSHTLDERIHKQDFLGFVNAYLADSDLGKTVAVVLAITLPSSVICTNAIHNAIVEDLTARYRVNAVPSPPTVIYLVEKGYSPTITTEDMTCIPGA